MGSSSRGDTRADFRIVEGIKFKLPSAPCWNKIEVSFVAEGVEVATYGGGKKVCSAVVLAL